MTRFFRSLAVLIYTSAALLLSGCGGLGDVELQGKVFDVIGATGLGGKREEVKLKPRAPLIMPPTSTGALPEPGSRVDPSDQHLAGLRDPDLEKVQRKAELEKAQKEYCEKHYDPQRDARDAVVVKGPLGSCRKSILDNVNLSGFQF